jgi:ribosomal protein L15E
VLARRDGRIDSQPTEPVAVVARRREPGVREAFEALAELTKQAEEAAKKPELLARANDRAKEDIARLLGYVAEGKTVVIQVK